MKTLFPVTCALTLTLCRGLAADTNSIIGEWRTGMVLSQLGPSVTTYTFNTNGTFRVAMTLTQGTLPAIGATGTYTVVANRIIKVVRGRTNSSAFSFEGKTLVLKEGASEVFRLTKKK